MGQERGQTGKQVRMSPEDVARLQEEDRQWRLSYMPSQVDVNGVDRECISCKGTLSPLHNQEYDGTTGGYCNKLCRKGHEKKLINGGMSVTDATLEIEKYEDWKPVVHSPVV